jgi:aminoglycoside phosphotransferase (APT) family kinase protein
LQPEDRRRRPFIPCKDSAGIVAAPEIVDTQREASEQELAPLIVREPLAAYLDERGLGSGPIRAERIGEGHSNVTYLIERDGKRFVLRRPPRPPLPPSAHDVLREARLLSAVEEAPVRTPRVLLACDDESVLGVPFYVMEYVEGTVITSRVPDPLDNPGERRRIAEELVDSLVEIHAVDWRAAGLEGYGKPSGYLERQLRRFNGLWEHNKTRELPVVQEVADWLAANLPESREATIVHGDYRLGNTMFANGAPARLIAIFDWELATIGDPLADVGYLTVSYSRPEDGVKETMFDHLSVTHADGFLERDELVTRYEERSGRSMSDLRWYQALALWKAAVFMEGNFKRSLAGTTDDPFLKLFDVGVPQLAEAARAITGQPAP